ncbi:hypothetical protein NUU61_001548 [Penicillium alfredii]|uniref:SNF2 N-terminal domain-containing protein n=1 Tax=Penicillium alfredii TaxID=1506179 RepID=A0A9W9G4Q7_9EURO|nr:uncharacterized protein NUU61_001548 [Penicillium alfredii]KAJ5111918.1 hypothetical protein NUU61_001548 [Penicillium alfredii]
MTGDTRDAPIIIDTTDDAGDDSDEDDSEDLDNDGAHDFVQTLLAQAGQAKNTRLDEVTANFELDRLNDPELWRMCQRFYKLRGMEGQTPSREIEIDGLNISLKPHQAFAAFYMLRSERRRHGGFLADEMGLGKTITTLAVCVLSRWLDTARIPLEAIPLTYRKEPFPVTQPIARVPTSSPSVLLRNWGQEWNKVVNTGHPRLQMTLLVGHRDNRALQRSDVRSWETLAQNNPSHHSLRFARARELAGALAWQKLLGTGDRQLCPRDQELIQEWMDAKDRRFPRERSQLWTGNWGKDCLVVLTTPQSYGTQVADALNCEATVEDASDRSNATGSVCGALWGRAFRDECHQERNEAKTYEVLKGFRGGTRLWFLSGTPFEISPADLARYVDCLWDQAWKDIPELARCSRADFEELGRQFISARDHRRTAMVVSEFRRRLQALGFIRRTVSSKWFGSDLLTLPEAERQDIACALDPAMRRAFRMELEQEYRQTQTRTVDKATNILHRLRLFTTFPALAQVSRQEHLPLTLDDINQQPWAHNQGGSFRTSPFQQHLRSILKGSAKFKQLCSLVQGLQRDSNGEHAKILVMSEFPVAAIITYLGLAEAFPEKHPVLLLSGQPQRNQRYIDAFNEMNTGSERFVENARGQFDRVTSPGVLVSTTRVLGLGFTCVRAFHAVLLEPSLLKSTEEQAFGRIRRIGQMNRRVYQVRLLTKDSEVEGQIVQRQATRQELQSSHVMPGQTSSSEKQELGDSGQE